MFVMFLYNLCLWLWTGQKSYAYYSGYVLTISVFVAGLHGLCFQYLWPESVAWHGNSVAVFTYFIVVGITGFSKGSFLQVRIHDAMMHRCLYAAGSVAAVGAVFFDCSLLIEYPVSYRVKCHRRFLMSLGRHSSPEPGLSTGPNLSRRLPE